MQFDLDTLCKAKKDLELKASLLENTLIKEKEEREVTQAKAHERIESLTNEINLVKRSKTGKLR